MIRALTLSLVFVILFACCAIPALSQPTLGIYYETDPYSLYAMPEIYSFFDGYLILHNADCGVTAVEFQLEIGDLGMQTIGFTVPPEATVYLGDPLTGMSIAYWPPLNSFMEDYLLLCTIHLFNVGGCYFDGGPIMDCPIRIREHPETGVIRIACAPDNELYPVIGLTSIVCRWVWPPHCMYVTVYDFDKITAHFVSDPPTQESAEDESRYLVIENTSPPDTLSVVSASLASPGSGSVRLTLERNMIDDTDYTLLTINMCNEYSCSDEEIYYHFNAAIGTALHSYSAERNNTGIMISWLMDEIDDGVMFKMLRADVEHGHYSDIPTVEIERDGLEFRFVDRSVEPGRSYRYRIEYELNGERRLLFETEPIEVPALPLTLYQNVPNPFNPATTIRYYVPEKCHVKLDIFNVSGKRIAHLADRTEGPGYREVVWNGFDDMGRTAASGIYLYRLIAGKETIAKKMVLLK